jgi:hypothetical protein
MSDFVQYAVRGVPLGCVFGLLAVGLVLTYNTSAVFNLAFAAQAYASAACYYVLRKEHEWNVVPAAVVAIVVLGVAMAVLLDRAMYRHMRTASPLAKLVTSLGLLIAVPQLVLLLIGRDTKVNPPPLWPVRRVDDLLWPRGSSFALDAGQIVTLIGSNGAGKTSTLRVIAGVLRPRAGSVRLAAHDLTRVPPHQIVRLRAIAVRLVCRPRMKVGVHDSRNSFRSRRIGHRSRPRPGSGPSSHVRHHLAP